VRQELLVDRRFMPCARRYALSIAALLAALLLIAAPAQAQTLDFELSAEQYVAQVGGGAQVIQYGELMIGDRPMSCGKRSTVLDPNLDDFAAAYPGFIILNPRRLAGVKPNVARWIYAHECGHQFRGPDEDRADCFAVQRGRRQNWLTAADVEDICTFIAPAQGDSMHFSGPMRCTSIRRCFGEKRPY
jgi:hypothetical protein